MEVEALVVVVEGAEALALVLVLLHGVSFWVEALVLVVVVEVVVLVEVGAVEQALAWL